MSRVEQATLSAAVRARTSVIPIGMDDWGHVRHVHSIAFDRLVAPWLDPEHAIAFQERTQSPEYVDELMEENLAAAWFDGQMVGTCGWQPADDAGAVARMTSLFVHPIFSRMGFGRTLLANVEERAASAGFSTLTLRAIAPSLPFFDALGYEISSHGVAALGIGLDMPVVFMRKAAPLAAAPVEQPAPLMLRSPVMAGRG